MRLVKPVIFVLLLGAASATGLPAGQTKDIQAEVALQAAIKMELVDGNLKGAIAQYRQLADGGDHAVAAKALVRLGQCYEKLGDAQARKAYDRVVRDFADQIETVAAAKARLAGLSRPAQPPPLAVRRVWSGSDVNTEGAPSRDGRFLSFTSRAGVLALRDLASGETRDLTKKTDVGVIAPGRSMISPDGKQAVFSRTTDDGSGELCLIGTDGTGLRVLYRDEHLRSIEPGAWFPDGARIVAVLAIKAEAGGSDVFQIASISLADGSPRILKTLGSRRGEPRGIAPDGRFIAYDYPPSEDAESRDVFLLAADGSRDIPLVEHPADDRLLGWVPDGSGVLFNSDRAGQWGAWFIRVVDGKPLEPPVLIRPELGPVEPLGFTRDGSFYYGAESGGTDVYVTELDPTASRLMSPPALINERFPGRNRLPLYAPNGTSLAYFSNRIADRWTLCVRSLATGDEREHLVPHDLERLRIARWVPGGQEILVSGFDKNLRHMGFYAIEARTGQTRAILSSNPEADTLEGPWAPDGKFLFLARAGFAFADGASRILQRDSATGSEREIHRLPPGEDVTNLVLSPNGQELAFTSRSRKGSGSFDGLGIVAVDGRDAREILRLSGWETIRRGGLAWTPDGAHLLFAKAIEISPHAFRLELWRTSPRNSETKNIGVLVSDMAFGDGSSGLSLHPNGKSVVFQAGPRKPEVWVMENVLPATKAESTPDFLNELTLEAWINFSDLDPSTQVIAAKGNFTYEGVCCSLGLTPEGRLQWGIRHSHTFYGDSGDWSIEGIIGDTVLRPNTWYHVAGTVYSSQSASLYLDGALLKTGPITQTIPARSTEPLNIGMHLYYGEPAYRFKGSVDGVAFQERALSAEEIRKHYLAGVQGKKKIE